MEKQFAKLAALGAMGVAGGSVALYLALIYLFAPTVTGGGPDARGGMDHIGWYTVIVAMAVPIVILAAVHVALANQLKKGPAAMHE